MEEELDWTCENCKYVDEDMEGTHCRHCIHNAEEHFEPKEVVLTEQEIRNKAISEFVNEIRDWQKEVYENDRYSGELDFLFKHIYEIAEEMRCAE